MMQSKGPRLSRWLSLVVLLTVSPTLAGTGTWTALPPLLIKNGSSNWDRVEALEGFVGADGQVTLFAGTYSGRIHRSLDGGVTWTTLDAESVAYVDVRGLGSIAISPDFANDHTVFAFSSQTYQFFRTTDGGSTWTIPCGGLSNPTCLPFNAHWDGEMSPGLATDQTLWVAGNGGLFRSVNGGTIWTRIYPQTNPNEGYLQVELSPAYPQDHTIFLGSTNLGMFRSTDAGTTWQQINVGFVPHTTFGDRMVERLAVSPDFTRDHMVFAMVGDILYRTSNGGDSWVQLAPPSRASGLALSPSFATDHTVAVTLDNYYHQTVAISTDAGATWTTLVEMPIEDGALLNFVAFSPDFGLDRTLYTTPGDYPGEPAIYAYTLPPIDSDQDGVADSLDNCPWLANAAQADQDGDDIGNTCDPCPADPANDADGDLACDDIDNCPDLMNPDQLDQDGDGHGDACDDDRDGDGMNGIHAGGTDTDDGGLYTELCNSIDDDLDGAVDEVALGDGLACDSGEIGECGAGSAVCQDGALVCLPNDGPVSETCNGLDDNCDGLVDEGVYQACYDGTNGTEGVGICSGGFQICSQGNFGACIGQILPRAELCNTLDENCNGVADENVTRSCYEGPQGTAGRGICQYGTQTCSNGHFGECVGDVWPAAEECNNLDDNCDGVRDGIEQPCYSGPTGTEGVGECAAGSQTCTSGTWRSCIGQVVPTAEVCNKRDDDCDGTNDEGQPHICYGLWVPSGPILLDGGPTETSEAVTSIAFSPAFAEDETMFAGSWSGHIYRSLDRGDTWDVTELGAHSWVIEALVVSPDFANDGTVLAASANGYALFRTVDWGDTWETVCDGYIDDECLPANAHWAMAFSPDFTNDRTVFESGNARVNVSYDGGETWQSIGQSLPGCSYLSLVVSPGYVEDHSLFISDNNGGVWRSTDSGSSWTRSSIMAPGSWVSVFDLALSPDFTTSRELLALVGGQIHRSMDRGVTWAVVGPSSYSFITMAMSPAYHRDGALAGAGSLSYTSDGVRISRNRGSSFTPLPALPFDGMNEVAFAPNWDDISTIYAAGWTTEGGMGIYSYTFPPPDRDNDSVPDRDDNCPNRYNPSQADSDGDGAGDPCDACPLDPEDDSDEDGRCANVDNCADIYNPTQENSDRDASGDLCDLCPLDPDDDIDGDGLCADVDNCPEIYNPGQEDMDGDGEGDDCDPDLDGDGVANDVDGCLYENALGQDADLDGCIDRLEDLRELIESLDLAAGIENSLLAKVDAALSALAEGAVSESGTGHNATGNGTRGTPRAQDDHVRGPLGALVNQILAQSGHRIPADDAELLLAFLHNVIVGLGF